MSPKALYSVSLALVMVGCNSDEPPPGEATSTTGTSTGGDTEDPSVGSVADETATTGASSEVPARAVRISLVEANPGTAVPIGRDGQWVGDEGRNTLIPKNRDTAIRVRVDVDEAVWVPRELEARLHLHLPDDSVETFSEVERITADSDDSSLESNFMFVVPAALMVPSLRYQVELYEAGEGWEGLPEPAEVPRTPADEPRLVGVETSEQVLRVMLVPIQYQSAECEATFDTSPENLQAYEDAMFQQNPVERVELEVHEPFLVDALDLTSPIDFLELLQQILALRASEQPDPNVYYYGIFDNCDQCVGFGEGTGCLLGVAGGLPDSSMGAASERAAIGTSSLDGMNVGPETFVHEIGHTQGRQHIECPEAQSGGPDPSYPHEDGRIGVWGYGVIDGQLRGAGGHSDYMSYCRPQWVSDWQWTATFLRIRELSGWSAGDMSVSDRAVLVGALNPETGQARWWTDRGYLEPGEPRAAGYALEFRGDGGMERLEVTVHPWSEGPWVTVRAPLSEGLLQADDIALRGPQRRYPIERAKVAVYHRPEDKATP